MAIQFEQVGAIGYAASTTVNVPYPSTVNENDILILQCYNFASNASITTPSGWTELYKSSKVSSHVWGFYAIRADGTETGSLTVTMGGSTASYGRISRWSGAITTGTAWEQATGVAPQNDSSAESASITSTGDNELAIALHQVHDPTSFGAYDGSYSEDFDVSDSSGYGSTFTASSQLKATAGNVASETSTIGVSDYHCGCSLFLIPPASGETNSQTQTGKSRIKKSATQTQTGVARLEKTATQTQTGTARIALTTTKTQDGVARIELVTQKTQQGTARINVTSTQTQDGVSRIKITTQKEQTGKANISVATTQTQQGTARIKATSTQTQDGTGRIKITSTQTQDGVAKISVATAKTQQGTARIKLVTAKTQDGVSRIEITSTQTQTGVAKISFTTPQTQAGVARIENANVTQTQQGKGRIKKSVAQTQSGVANISTGGAQKTITGVAKIERKINYDNGASTSGTSASITLSNFTVGNNPDRILLVGISIRDDSTVSSITFNTSENFSYVTGVGQSTGTSRTSVEIWKLVNPTATTADIVVTLDSAPFMAKVGAISLFTVHQTDSTPTTATQTGASGDPSINITTQHNNSWVLDTMHYRPSSSASATYPQVERWVLTPTTIGAGSTKEIETAGSTSMSWTIGTSNPWAQAAIEIRAPEATGVTTTKTQTGKADIKNTNTQTQSGVANITSPIKQQNITGKALLSKVGTPETTIIEVTTSTTIVEVETSTTISEVETGTTITE